MTKNFGHCLDKILVVNLKVPFRFLSILYNAIPTPAIYIVFYGNQLIYRDFTNKD